jgi:solute carrier family 15 (oligopeptide transporter), member 1
MASSNETSNNETDNEPLIIQQKFPKRIFLIVITEFCERYTYLGLRAILFIYLTTFINLSEPTGTAIYHVFNVLCYFSPILGCSLSLFIN